MSSISCFFKFSAKDLPLSVEEPTSKVNGRSSSKQQNLELNVLNSEKISAEIMWVLNCCLNGISSDSNQDTFNLFQITGRLQNHFKWDQIKLGTVSLITLVLISNRFTYQIVESIPLACCVF